MENAHLTIPADDPANFLKVPVLVKYSSATEASVEVPGEFTINGVTYRDLFYHFAYYEHQAGWYSRSVYVRPRELTDAARTKIRNWVTNQVLSLEVAQIVGKRESLRSTVSHTRAELARAEQAMLRARKEFDDAMAALDDFDRS